MAEAAEDVVEGKGWLPTRAADRNAVGADEGTRRRRRQSLTRQGATPARSPPNRTVSQDLAARPSGARGFFVVFERTRGLRKRRAPGAERRGAARL